MDRHANHLVAGGPLAILAEIRPPHTTVLVRGELDLAAVAQLCACVDEVLKQGIQDLTLDLNGVTFLDAAGIGALVHVRNQMVQRGAGTLRVVCASHEPRALLRLTAMENALNVEQTPADENFPSGPRRRRL